MTIDKKIFNNPEYDFLREKIVENDFAPIFSTPKSSGKKVSRVIVLYTDRTFESFTEF